ASELPTAGQAIRGQGRSHGGFVAQSMEVSPLADRGPASGAVKQAFQDLVLEVQPMAFQRFHFVVADGAFAQFQATNLFIEFIVFLDLGAEPRIAAGQVVDPGVVFGKFVVNAVYLAKHVGPSSTGGRKDGRVSPTLTQGPEPVERSRSP